ncbi:MAG: 1-deoxy-D-xylulose-5-phosphate synthase [Clostridia bacterium]|nr:1-deoxy-D-xylulose-5-phosphate synthase [Clostridia bacterium]
MMEQNRDARSLRYPRLYQINSPEDLKAMPREELAPLAEEIRAFLVERVLENGGHLASNLGAVELTLAIHRVFSSPKDHILFDVGHQSYVHKLITGRRDRFDELRRGGGLSGFPKRSESEHDCFGAGHSSTSLSAALGFAEADRISGSDAYTVCVFGDGAYTGGMIHEALNNSRGKLRLIMILNENEMSISKNIGRFARELSHLRSSEGYFRTKDVTAKILCHIPLIGRPLFNGLRRMKNALKSALYGTNYFENLGLNYLGPVDGNDEEAVERLLREAKESEQACIIHLKTQKGKGYAPAEADPGKYHGVAPAGRPVNNEPTFSEEMGKLLTERAANDERICAITAAMTLGTGLTPFKETFPDRFFDVGIAEAHAVTFAAGLAANGYRPVVAIYSSFLQRAYDNIIHDVALQELPVVFCIDRAGLNPSDGATHHGMFDVAFLSEIPGLRLYTPITQDALSRALDSALQSTGPVAIRYPNGRENGELCRVFYGREQTGSVRSSYSPKEAETLDGVIVTHGRIASEALAAARLLEEKGFCTGVLLLEQLCPYAEVAKEVAGLLPEKACRIILLEEEIYAGGMGMMLSDALSSYPRMQGKSVHIMALKDQFAVQEKDEPIWRSVGLDRDSIVSAMLCDR